MERKFQYPKITLSNENKYYITIYANGKRFRLYNGSSLGIDIYPNSFPETDRLYAAKLLAAEIFKALQKGNIPSKPSFKKLNDVESLRAGLDQKLAQPFSKHHKTMLKYAYRA